jgi:hypothetical protein
MKISVTILIFFMLSLLITVRFKTSHVLASAELPAEMPVVFVDPSSIDEAVGEQFTVAVKIFNLTSNFYETDEEWMPGDPLPPPGYRYTLSLGNLYSFDITMSWDPVVLEYVSHEVMVPYNETSLEGILNAPADKIDESLDTEAGTLVVTYGSRLPAEEFNCPDDNATVFEMTFNVVKEGACSLSLDEVTLYQRKLKFPEAMHIIPHWKINGQFRTPGARTRIEKLEVGALVGTQLYAPPLILGENATIKITVRNDGMVSDTYNLTLYHSTFVLKTWNNESLESGEHVVYNYTLKTEDLTRGYLTISANATIMHDSQLIYDSLPTQFRVVDTPLPEITISPTDVAADETVTLDASGSTHKDPDSSIKNYTWFLYEPGTPIPRQELKGKEATYSFDKNGTWRIVLIVTDNWGLTYAEERPATESYRTETTLDVSPKAPPSPFNIENIALIIIVVAAVALILIYIRRRMR